MSGADMRAQAISARLRDAARAADLVVDRRLDPKIDYSRGAVTARLRTVAELLRVCRALERRRR